MYPGNFQNRLKRLIHRFFSRIIARVMYFYLSFFSQHTTKIKTTKKRSNPVTGPIVTLPSESRSSFVSSVDDGRRSSEDGARTPARLFPRIFFDRRADIFKKKIFFVFSTRFPRTNFPAKNGVCTICTCEFTADSDGNASNVGNPRSTGFGTCRLATERSKNQTRFYNDDVYFSRFERYAVYARFFFFLNG